MGRRQKERLPVLCAMRFFYETLNSVLSRCRAADNWYIGYSGGVDSHVLLHFCASHFSLGTAKITAVHVHHGLQQQADHWALHCRRQAAALGIAYVRMDVDGKPKKGESPEEAARNARYAALRSLMKPGDILLTGQHREDQLETILLQLFRGAGLAGLSGMPLENAFGKGKIVRPMLNVAGWQIKAYALQHALQWVEDPSNESCDYDRNFLRNRVIPLLKQRWPAIDKTVTRSGNHCAEANGYLQEADREIFAAVYNEADRTLSLPHLRSYIPYAQRRIVRAWFRKLDLRMPSSARLGQLLNHVVVAAPDRDPKWHCDGFVVRRYRDRLYCLPVRQPIKTDYCLLWGKRQTTLTLTNHDRLSIVETQAGGIAKQVWEQARINVRYRQGGESIRLPGRRGSQPLKKLFQTHGVPPWLRETMPLIYFGGQLAAVGDLWIDEQFYNAPGAANIRLHWVHDSSNLKTHDEN